MANVIVAGNTNIKATLDGDILSFHVDLSQSYGETAGGNRGIAKTKGRGVSVIDVESGDELCSLALTCWK